MKRIIALFAAAAIMLSLFCSCGKNKATSFDFTLESFVEGFNEANTELADIDSAAISEIEYTDDSLFAKYEFTDALRFCANIEPESRKVQKMFMWLDPSAIEDKENAYKFAAYNAIMLSCFVDSQEEYEEVVKALSLDTDLEFFTDTMYEGDDFAAYYTFDVYGYRLIIVTLAEMEQIEAQAQAAEVQSE